MSDCCLTPNEQFFSYIMARISCIPWKDDKDLFMSNTPNFIFIVLAYWNKSPRVDISLHLEAFLIPSHEGFIFAP